MQETSALILSGGAPYFEKENTGRLFGNEKYIMKSLKIISKVFLFFF